MLMLRQIRESRGLTLKQLGEMIGQTESSIGLYENGRRSPNFETLLKLSEVLNCSVDSILGNNFALTVEEEHLLFFFRLLNEEGRKQAISIVATLTNSPALSQKNNTDSTSESV